MRERRLTATLHQQKCPVFHLGSNGTYKTNSQIRPHLRTARVYHYLRAKMNTFYMTFQPARAFSPAFLRKKS